MSELDRPSLPVEYPPGCTFSEDITHFALTPEQKEEAIAEYLQVYLRNYAESNNMHAPQELIDRAFKAASILLCHILIFIGIQILLLKNYNS